MVCWGSKVGTLPPFWNLLIWVGLGLNVIPLNPRWSTCYTLTFVMSPYVMSLPLLILEPLGNIYVLNLNLPHGCHIHLSYVMGFDVNMIHKRIQTMQLHALRCHHCQYRHYCNVYSTLFHNVTWYTNLLSSCILVNIGYLLDIICTLVATITILERLECTTWEEMPNIPPLGQSFVDIIYPKHLLPSKHIEVILWLWLRSNQDKINSFPTPSQGDFTLWPKVERPSIFTNQVARNQELGLTPLHNSGRVWEIFELN